MELQGAPEGADNIRFDFGGLTLDGVTVYSGEELGGLYQDKIGTEISLADLYAIANRMTVKYRNDGYILTRVVVPPQTIESGIARLQVVEGHLDRITVEADESESQAALDLISGYAARISTGGPLNVRDMERGLLLINDLPGLSARSILKRSKTTPGASDMVIIVERDPFDAFLGADNFGSRYLGPVQLTSAATLNSMLGYNEEITGQFVVAPDSGYELAYGSLQYEQPINSHGTRLSAFLSKTDTDPGYDLEQFDVRGYSTLASVKATHPFIRSRSTNLSGRLSFDWRNVKSANNIELTRRDRLRVLRAGGSLDFVDQLLGVAVNVLDLEVSHGLDILGATGEGDANITRAAGDPTFAKVNGQVQRLQRVTDEVNILLNAQGQLADGPLLSSEEFSVGGINSARGFDPSEIVGDHGLIGKAEIQWNNPFDVDEDSERIEKLQLYSFIDAGRVWNDDATTSADKVNSLASAGAGVRVNFIGQVETGLGVAFPLNRDVQTQQDRDPKVYFNLSKKF